MNETIEIPSINNQQQGGLHCSKDALTDVFGWFLQVMLACLAFTCLIAKRFCEPKHERRSWLIWFYDTSKQGMGALAIHFSNVWLAGQYTGDPCTWYIINFLLDSSLGLFIVFIGIRLAQFLARRRGWEAINFGEYGKPPSMNAWLAQCCLYLGLMVIVKTSITLFMQLDFWEKVKDFILSPINNPKVELAFVMLIIPFFVNILMFWVTDNFLMHRNRKMSFIRIRTNQSLLNRAKIQYRSIRGGGGSGGGNDRTRDSESDLLLSGDEDLLDPDNIFQRTPTKPIVT